MQDVISSILLGGDNGDRPAGEMMRLLGIGGPDSEGTVRALHSVIFAPDLSEFVGLFGCKDVVRRDSTPAVVSVGKREGAQVGRLYSLAFSDSGRSCMSQLFWHENAGARDVLSKLRAAAASKDSMFALGAVVLACAFRAKLRA